MIDDYPPTGRTAASTSSRCGPTHHHACACREEQFVRVEGERDALRAENQRLRDRDANSTDHLRAALAREKSLRAKIKRLRDRARRFKGWRIVYEIKRIADDTWREVKRPLSNDLRDVSASARYLRDPERADRVRNVRIVRVYRRAKEG